MIHAALAAIGGVSTPLVTWRDGALRAELSGRTLANAINKAANYLVDDADVDLDTCVHVDLDAHWQSPVWRSAVLLAGGTLVPAALADVVVAFPSQRVGDGPHHAVSRHPLGLADREVPSGWANASADVMGCADIYLGPRESAQWAWWDGATGVSLADIRDDAVARCAGDQGTIAVTGHPAAIDAITWHVAAPVILGRPVLLCNLLPADAAAAEHVVRHVEFAVG